MINNILRAHLVAVRAGAHALVLTIDALLAAGEKPIPKPQPTASGACAHPERDRTPAPRMGNPNATICGRCQAELPSLIENSIENSEPGG